MDTMQAETTETAEMIAETAKAAKPRQFGNFDHPSFHFHDRGILNLIGGENGVIRRAVEDAKDLSRAGVLVHGHLAVDKMPRRLCEGMTIAEAKELLLFFKDENLGLLLQVSGIDIEPKRIRAKIGFDW